VREETLQKQLTTFRFLRRGRRSRRCKTDVQRPVSDLALASAATGVGRINGEKKDVAIVANRPSIITGCEKYSSYFLQETNAGYAFADALDGERQRARKDLSSRRERERERERERKKKKKREREREREKLKFAAHCQEIK